MDGLFPHGIGGNRSVNGPILAHCAYNGEALSRRSVDVDLRCNYVGFGSRYVGANVFDDAGFNLFWGRNACSGNNYAVQRLGHG